MTQSAVVKRRVNERQVEVLVKRRSACGHDCAGCAGGCPSMVKEPEVLAVAEDALGAQPGQSVTVESSSRRVLGLAALLYLLPFAAFFLGYVLLGFWGGTAAILGAVGAFLAALIGVCMPLDRHIRRRGETALRVVSVEG